MCACDQERHDWFLRDAWLDVENMSAYFQYPEHPPYRELLPNDKKVLDLSQLLYSICDNYDERSGNDG